MVRHTVSGYFTLLGDLNLDVFSPLSSLFRLNVLGGRSSMIVVPTVRNQNGL